jgi:hypothetical protein
LSKLTLKKKEEFFNVLADGGSVTAAASAIGVTRQAVYQLRKTDAQFAVDWDDAIEAGTDILEDEAVKRAKNHSDTLLIFLLKARRPDKYKERSETELTIRETELITPKEDDEGE